MLSTNEARPHLLTDIINYKRQALLNMNVLKISLQVAAWKKADFARAYQARKSTMFQTIKRVYQAVITYFNKLVRPIYIHSIYTNKAIGTMKDLLAHPQTVRVDQLLQTNSLFKELIKLHVNCALKISWYYKQCDNTAKCQYQLTGLVFFGVLRTSCTNHFLCRSCSSSVFLLWLYKKGSLR